MKKVIDYIEMRKRFLVELKKEKVPQQDIQYVGFILWMQDVLCDIEKLIEREEIERVLLPDPGEKG